MSVTVPAARGEEARAKMLEIFPEGFEEVDHEGGVELVAYTDPGGEERLWQAFGSARASDIEPGWEDGWRRFHHPARIGSIWIGPPWLEPDEDAIAVVVDPGRAFGTGAHATTRLCVELLAGLEPGPLLDIGCGSGVLSIAAAKLGWAPVLGIDIDPNAVEATLRNAEDNGVVVEARLVDAMGGSALPPAATVVANISVEAVRSLPQLEAERAITSGYLASDVLDLPGFRRADRREAEGWAADLHVRAQ